MAGSIGTSREGELKNTRVPNRIGGLQGDKDAFIRYFSRVISNYNSERVVCLVEGRKDRQALLAVGIMFVEILSGPSLFVLERISEDFSRIAILTDFDPQGRRLYRKVIRESSPLGLKVDSSLRELLISSTPLSVIEGLDSYLKGVGILLPLY